MVTVHFPLINSWIIHLICPLNYLLRLKEAWQVSIHEKRYCIFSFIFAFSCNFANLTEYLEQVLLAEGLNCFYFLPLVMELLHTNAIPVFAAVIRVCAVSFTFNLSVVLKLWWRITSDSHKSLVELFGCKALENQAVRSGKKKEE